MKIERTSEPETFREQFNGYTLYKVVKTVENYEPETVGCYGSYDLANQVANDIMEQAKYFRKTVTVYITMEKIRK